MLQGPPDLFPPLRCARSLEHEQTLTEKEALRIQQLCLQGLALGAGKQAAVGVVLAQRLPPEQNDAAKAAYQLS